MRGKEKDRKAKIASNKVLLASVTEEMAQPRVATSTSIETGKQIMQGMESLRTVSVVNGLKTVRG
jgi:hypothetical protein